MTDTNQVRWQRIILLHEGSTDSTKGDRRALQIVEKATKLIAVEGYEALSFQSLSKKCKITRPLIHHYFEDKEQLLLAVIQYVGVEHQKFILSKMPSASKAPAILESYINGNLLWPLEKKEHAQVWMHYLALAGYNPRDQAENTKSVDNGWNRIWEILQQGAKEKAWNDQELRYKARALQILITGAVISLITEKRTHDEAKHLIQMVLREGNRILTAAV